jgi:hypothetical protein
MIDVRGGDFESPSLKTRGYKMIDVVTSLFKTDILS